MTKKMTPIEALRAISGIFDPATAVDRLVLCNLIARYLDKCEVLDTEFFIDQFKKIGIELDLGDQ